jgi:hypothetical protein|tara:strand:+ start:54 stop:431 length:378 start_codon:yes stop_codon:yes gene_type:complete
MSTTLSESERNDIDAQLSYENVTKIIGDLHESEDESEDYTYFDRVHEMVLSVEEKKLYEICLGTGGPGYHLNVQVNGSGNLADIEKMSYTYLNWFYRKEIPIEKGTEEWKVWEEFAANFVEEWVL